MTRPRACAATGVAAGLAEHLGWPVLVVRVAFVATSLAAGAGLLLYLWLWALTPWAPGEQRPTRRAPVAWLLVAASSVALVVAWATSSRVAGADEAGLRWWFGAVFAGVGLAVASGAWASFIDRPEPERGPRHELTIRIVATVLLAVTAVALVFGPIAHVHPVPTFAAALAAVLGLGGVAAPTLVPAWRELTEERTKRIREEQRSEIAAHLHDSVLQLSLIHI